MGHSSNNWEEIDKLLEAIRGGDEGAWARLMPLVEVELRRMAHSSLRFRNRNQSWCTTEVLDEFCLRVLSKPPREWKNRADFLMVAATTMRNILVDYYRKMMADKRGGDRVREDAELDRIAKTEERWLINGVAKNKGEWVLDLDEVLGRLERENETWARIVDMQFFGGMTLEEIAEVLHTTRDAVRGQWRYAQAWLNREMTR